MYLQRWHGWCHKNLLPSRRVLCTPYNHAPCHFMQSHIRMVYACLVVTCHLRFWQNDRDLLRATAVTRGWNGYRNKSQHRKSTLEKKILPLLQQGFDLATFRSRVRRSNHWAIPAPQMYVKNTQTNKKTENLLILHSTNNYIPGRREMRLITLNAFRACRTVLFTLEPHMPIMSFFVVTV